MGYFANLYSAHGADRTVSRLRTSTLAGIPCGTGLRVLTGLEKRGLIRRIEDTGRCGDFLITLNDSAIDLMEMSLSAFLEETGPDIPQNSARRQRWRDRTEAQTE